MTPGSFSRARGARWLTRIAGLVMGALALSPALADDLAPSPGFPGAPQRDLPSIEAPRVEDQHSVAPPQDERRYIDAEEFRRQFENRTVHLTSDGMHYGSEYYLPGDRALWIGAGGPCRQGEWVYRKQLFCFTYGAEGPHCWHVFEHQGEYYAESLDGLVLHIYSVEERPLNCDPGLFS